MKNNMSVKGFFFGLIVFMLFVVTIGSATVSARVGGGSAISFSEYASNPVFDPLTKAYYPSLLYDAHGFIGHGDTTYYKMWFGSNSGIGYAYSDDGKSWTGGTNPVSGLTNANHPLVEYYENGFSCDGEVTCYYRMWYWDQNQLYSMSAIRYAESSNGVDWFNDQAITGNIISGVAGEWNGGSYGATDVIYNPTATNTGINPFDYSFVMYFDATTGGFEEIGLGYSSDAKNWQLYGKVLPRGNDGAWGNTNDWDSSYTTFGTIIKESDVKWHMWYSGGQSDSNDGIGYATSSDGINWVRDENNPIFHQNDGVSWRSERTYTPQVIYDSNKFSGHGDSWEYKMWFSGVAAGNYAIGYAYYAPTPTTVYIDSAYTESSAGSHIFGYDAFLTIQEGINAVASSGTVNVAAGTYDEQVIITKSLTIQGAEDTPIIKPSQTTADNFQLFDRVFEGDVNTAGIIITDASENSVVTIQNLKVDGSLVSSTPTGARFIGILYRDSASGLIDSVTVNDIGINEGNGILLSGYDFPVTVEVKDSIVSGYLKNGITANNDGMTANIHDNTITGMGSTTSIAQNGIQIGFGAEGMITHNTISGNVWTGTYGSTNNPIEDDEADGATGILLYMPGSDTIEISNNVLTENQFGIWTVAAPDINIYANTITGLAHTGNAYPTGIAIWSADMWIGYFDGSEQSTSGTVTNNVFSSHDYGLIVRDYATDGPTPTVIAHTNSIENNELLGVWSNVNVDAENNWWGTANKPTITDLVSGDVDFEPYYVDSDMTILSTALETVYVDDGYSDGNADGHIFGYDAFLTIQEGIDAVATGGTIYVSAGTYQECLNLYSEEDLEGSFSLIGEDKETTIIDGSNCEDIIYIEGGDVSIQGFTILNNNEGEDYQTSAIYVYGESVTISNVIIDGNGNYYGIYMESMEGEQDNSITGSITNSVVKNACTGLYIDDASDVLIEGNEITLNGVKALCTTEPTTGIDVYSSSDVTIQDNEITDNDIGVHVDPYGEECSSGVVITKNKITGNNGNEFTDGYGVIAEECEFEEGEGTDYSVEARLNWWGSADGPEAEDNPGEGDKVEGDRVSYSPWYTSDDMRDFSGVLDEGDEGDSLSLPDAITLNLGDMIVEIPEGITITGGEGWTGVINAPTIKEVAIVSPIDSGYTGEVDQVIEIGFPDVMLTFDKAVKIIIPNAAGKLVGYARTGEPFHRITNVCGENSQVWADANILEAGDCKIDAGSDLVVWTKHFTEFVTYTQTQNPTAPSSGGSSGHSGSSSNCEYKCAAWGACVNGKQTRTCTPNTYCDENDPNKALTERTCSTTEENIPLETKSAETTPTESEQGSQPTQETVDQGGNTPTSRAVTAITSGFGAHPWLAGLLAAAIIGGLGIFVYAKFRKQ